MHQEQWGELSGKPRKIQRGTVFSREGNCQSPCETSQRNGPKKYAEEGGTEETARKRQREVIAPILVLVCENNTAKALPRKKEDIEEKEESKRLKKKGPAEQMRQEGNRKPEA